MSFKFDYSKPIKVVTVDGVEYFATLATAQLKYPDLDPEVNGQRFTSACHDGEYERFEDWPTYNVLSR